MFRLHNSVQPYAWGSTTAIATLQGRPASSSAEAELWLGAHPKAPSQVIVRERHCGLNVAIAEDPRAWIGETVQRAHGAELPFLLKALAAETPLSLQAHPSIAQAKAGYAAEDAAGLPVDAPNRNYRDRNHKPELICALTPFEALCGFRPLREAHALYSLLDLAETRPAMDMLGANALDSMRHVFVSLMSAQPTTRQRIANAVAQRAASLLAERAKDPQVQRFSGSLHWATQLSKLYAGDIGVATSLLLNQVSLQPGEALYLPAGNLHAYLHGFGIELMANSDNVLRGGCTPKHVDVAELIKVLDFSCAHARILLPDAVETGVARYVTDAAEFELAVLSINGTITPKQHTGGPEILLVTRGEAQVSNGEGQLSLKQGESAFVRASGGLCTFSGQNTTIYRASVGTILA